MTGRRPMLELLSLDLLGRVLDEAFQLMQEPGILVHASEARDLLAEAGASADDSGVVRIPEAVARRALETVPSFFALYSARGEKTVEYGEHKVHFDPGSSGVNILDPETLKHRPAETPDLIRLIKVAEMLPEMDAQSTAVVCSDVSPMIGDLYRLYLVLLFSEKPVVTGAFANRSSEIMIDMLAAASGGRDELHRKPRAVFDVCPTPPLVWDHFGAQNLIDLARAGVPAQIVSMPLSGAAAPVTLIGSVVQHAAECISGITIHQMARSGSPIVWGGAPAIFDMRFGTTPMGAIETAMIDLACAQVGKSFGLPTHAYLGASDAKIVDAQSGMESGIGAMMGALAGINMISGAGMLDFLACQSPEKLVIDCEGIAMAKRFLEGIQVPTQSLATEFFEGINFRGDFLKQRATLELFSQEQILPSQVVDRGTLRSWEDKCPGDAFQRARRQVAELVSAYEAPLLPQGLAEDLGGLVGSAAQEAGMAGLPSLEQV